MQFSCDRTGFPLLSLPDVALDVHLFPVTKVQCESFIGEPNEFGDRWYEEVLVVNLRVSHRSMTAQNRERCVLTGILPEEALAFARWLGDGFDLPTMEEWRTIYRALSAQSAPLRRLNSFLTQQAAELARSLFQQMQTQFDLPSLLDLSLMQGGVVEWVRYEQTWVGLGAPRTEFLPNVWNPLMDEVRPIRAGERIAYFGFRLVRRWSRK